MGRAMSARTVAPIVAEAYTRVTAESIDVGHGPPSQSPSRDRPWRDEHQWAVVERDADDWHVLDRGQVATPMPKGPGGRRAATLRPSGPRRSSAARGSTSVGVGVPGLYDPVAGTTRFLVNFPGTGPGCPWQARSRAALGLPTALINDARAFGLAELRLGAARGADLDHRADTRNRHRWRHRDRRPRPPRT